MAHDQKLEQYRRDYAYECVIDFAALLRQPLGVEGADRTEVFVGWQYTPGFNVDMFAEATWETKRLGASRGERGCPWYVKRSEVEEMISHWEFILTGFKAGDRVRIKHSSALTIIQRLYAGKLGSVLRLGPTFLDVAPDEARGLGNHGLAYRAEQLKLVKEKAIAETED